MAQAQLVLNYQFPVDQAATNWVQLVAWGLNANENGAVTNFPGLGIPPTNVNNFAIETLTYLQLKAGTNRFYFKNDDSVAFYTGTNLTDTSIPLLQANNMFDFVVANAGLYPLHIIYEEGGGAAYLVLNSVNLSDNSVGPLVNDAANGGVPAFYPLVVAVIHVGQRVLHR